LALDKDAPVSRPVQRTGVVRSLGILGGLHHHYARAWVLGRHNGADCTRMVGNSVGVGVWWTRWRIRWV